MTINKYLLKERKALNSRSFGREKIHITENVKQARSTSHSPSFIRVDEAMGLSEEPESHRELEISRCSGF